MTNATPSTLTECYSCIHRRDVPGSALMRCSQPSERVRKNGHPYGVRSGWFYYPDRFDPSWRTDGIQCCNYKEREEEQ